MRECTKCRLHKSCSTVCVWGEGVKNPEIMVIGEAPGATEDSLGRPFVGKAGKLLRELLHECGLERVYISNIVKCRPPGNRPPKADEVRACLPYLEEEIKHVQPGALVLLGASAIKAVTGDRQVSVGVYRGRANWDYLGVPCIATYHPAAALRDPDLLPKMVDDILRIRDLKMDRQELEILSVEEVTTKMLEQYIAVDIETTQIDPFAPGGEILCVAWSGKRGEAYVTQNVDSFIYACMQKAPAVICHNAKFEFLWFLTKYPKFAGRYLAGPQGFIYDTMVMAHLLDENLPSYSLKYLSSVHTGFGDYAKEISPLIHSGKVKEVPTEALMKYCAYDAAATFQIYNTLRFEDDQQILLFDEQMELLSAIVQMEARGFQVDVPRLNNLRRTLDRQIESLTKRIYHMSDAEIQNPDSGRQVAHYLYDTLGLPISKRTPKGAPSVDEEAIEELLERSLSEGVHYLLLCIAERRKLRKLVSTYLVGVLEHINPDERVVRPSYNQIGTVTGRFSCSSPNMQNLPRGSKPPIKSIFVARDGKKLIQADYSQIELRMGAYLSRDKAMLQALRDGQDLHTLTAQRIFGIEEVTKEQRTQAKTVNFGTFYGMGPTKLQKETGMPLRAASKFIKSWFLIYPGVKAWFEEVKDELIEKGYVESIFGRRRRLPLNVTEDEGKYAHMIRQACNFPVQSAASDLTQMAMITLSKNGYHVLGNVHDSIILETDLKHVEYDCRGIKYILEHPNDFIKGFGFKVEIDIPTPVEIVEGYNLNEMEAVNGEE